LQQKIFIKKMYSNPSRRDGTPPCLALRYRVIAKIDNVVEYIKTSFLHPTHVPTRQATLSTRALCPATHCSETEVDSDASESLIPSSVTLIKASTRGRPRTRQPARSTPRSRGTGKRPGRGRSRPVEKPIHSQPVSVPMGDDDPPHTIPNTQ